MTIQNLQPTRVAFLLDSLSGGGAERVMLNLASGFASSGHITDLLVCKMKGELQNQVPPNVNVVELGSTSALRGVATAMLADPGSLRSVLYNAH